MKAAESEQYQQELSRSIGIWGNIAITLSAVTPASSVFIIIPLIITSVGTGSFTAMVLGAIVGVFMAFCWAELGAKFPIVGGDYSVIRHAFAGPAKPFGGFVSFLSFALFVGSSIAFIPAVIALGTADYLSVVWDVDTETAGAVVCLLAAGIAILNIRVNAVVTGIFLAIELLALGIVTVLGLVHWERSPVDFVTDPVIGNGDAVTFSMILSLTAVSIFAYNGYSTPIFFAEETRGPSRNIARAILISLGVTVAAELIPMTAVLIGAPSINELTTGDQNPLNYFLLSTSNSTVNDIVSLAIVLAIFNAVIAIILEFGRALYSSGRDRAWPGPVNKWMSEINPRFQSPMIATAFLGILGAVLCLTVSLSDLIKFTGATLVANYALVALGALVGRATGATSDSPYKMPFWPLPPLLAIGALVYVTTKQTHTALVVTGVTIAIGVIYYLIVLLPQGDKAWLMRQPLYDVNDPAHAPAADSSSSS